MVGSKTDEAIEAEDRVRHKLNYGVRLQIATLSITDIVNLGRQFLNHRSYVVFSVSDFAADDTDRGRVDSIVAGRQLTLIHPCQSAGEFHRHEFGGSDVVSMLGQVNDLDAVEGLPLLPTLSLSRLIEGWK